MAMHPPRTAAHAAALWIALAFLPALAQPTQARAGDALDDARARLTRKDPAGAVALLEAALPGTEAARRPALLVLLREAYEAAARQAEAAGRRDEAEAFRENLAILSRAPRRAASPAPAETPASASPRIPPPTAPEPAPSELALPTRARSDPEVKRAVVENPGEPAAQAFVAPLPAPSDSPAESPEPLNQRRVPEKSLARVRAAAPSPAPSLSAGSGPNIETADAAFLAKKYETAGAIYAELERRKGLPGDRRDHWAYCRAVEVVRRINARPRAASEWAAIESEIEQIRRLSPSNWFAEYLRNRAAERNPNARAAALLRADKEVVRCSSPEEDSITPPAPKPAAPRRLGPSSTAPGALSPARSAPVPSPSSDAAGAGPSAGEPQAAAAWNWSPQPVFTANFQVVYPEGQKELAGRVAKAAEVARATLVKRWGEANPGMPWSPRCEVLLFPTAAEFSRATGQPPESPGISTLRMTEGRIDGRRINLRADHAGVVHAVLPHEVTHVVLADLFPHKQIPRWADEGMAVLSEPSGEQNVRASDLDEPLAAGKVFRVSDLVTMDYPDPRYLGLYYAQSVSLTRFLVDQGSPAQFIKFVQQAQWAGFEPALKDVYQISNFPDLQSKWLTYARTKAGPQATATASADATGETTRR